MTPNRSGRPPGQLYFIAPDPICGVRAWFLTGDRQVESGPPANMPKTLRNLMTRRGHLEIPTPPQYAVDAVTALTERSEDRPLLGTVVERMPQATISAGPFFCDARAGIGGYKVARFPDPLDDPYAPMMPDLITQEGGEW